MAPGRWENLPVQPAGMYAWIAVIALYLYATRRHRETAEQTHKGEVFRVKRNFMEAEDRNSLNQRAPPKLQRELLQRHEAHRAAEEAAAWADPRSQADWEMVSRPRLRTQPASSTSACGA